MLSLKDLRKIAVLSVFDKTGIVDFGRRLTAVGRTILSSGGTAAAIRAEGVPVLTVAQLREMIFRARLEALGWNMKVTRKKRRDKKSENVSLEEMFRTIFPTEVLGHRVATLHPEVHGGILAANDMLEELHELGYPEIELVCVDLYPLEKTIAEKGDNLRAVLDSIDIGGPTLLMGAAKNNRIVISHAKDRERVLQQLEANGDVDEDTRQQLAADAFARIAQYRLLAAKYLSGDRITGMILEKTEELTYGENANQKPAYIASEFDSQNRDPLAFGNFTQVQGLQKSFNTSIDFSRLMHVITHLAANLDLCEIGSQNLAVVVKHGNACGIGVSSSRVEALQYMIDGNRLAIHGGVMCVNFAIGEEEAKTILRYGMPPDSKPRLIDGVFAPSFSEQAMEILQRPGANKLRLFTNPALLKLDATSMDQSTRFVQIRGAWAIQPPYDNALNITDTSKFMQFFVPMLDEETIIDLCIAQAASHSSNSNTIALAKNGMLIGNGVGQQDRVGSAELSVNRARACGHNVEDSAGSGDSFFPWPDGIEVLADAGVRIVLATYGSITGDPALMKMLSARREQGKPYPAVLLYSDKTNRGFCHHG